MKIRDILKDKSILNAKEITDNEIEMINSFCTNFLLIYCKLNNINDNTEIDKVFDKMYNNDLINIALMFKEKYYPNSEMDPVDFENYAGEVIVGTYGEKALQSILRSSLN